MYYIVEDLMSEYEKIDEMEKYAMWALDYASKRDGYWARDNAFMAKECLKKVQLIEPNGRRFERYRNNKIKHVEDILKTLREKGYAL